MLFGLLIRAWSPLDLYKRRPQATDLCQSINTLHAGLQIRLLPRDPFTEPEGKGTERSRDGTPKRFDHAICELAVLNNVGKIQSCILNAESPVQESHLRHVEGQAKKGKFV